jgi:hypothetical protein
MLTHSGDTVARACRSARRRSLHPGVPRCPGVSRSPRRAWFNTRPRLLISGTASRRDRATDVTRKIAGGPPGTSSCRVHEWASAPARAPRAVEIAAAFRLILPPEIFANRRLPARSTEGRCPSVDPALAASSFSPRPAPRGPRDVHRAAGAVLGARAAPAPRPPAACRSTSTSAPATSPSPWEWRRHQHGRIHWRLGAAVRHGCGSTPSRWASHSASRCTVPLKSAP